jgi:uncharacterized protein DUF3572
MRLKPPKARPVGRPEAETIAAGAIKFLADEPSRLSRFFAVTGISPNEIASLIGSADAGLLAAALDFVAADESLLLVYAATLRLQPEAVVRAHQILTQAADVD